MSGFLWCAAGGAYINKMSNYCKKCHYDVGKKTGSDACPFNYLYWNFLISNRTKLKGNARLGMMYRNLDRMEGHKIDTIKEDADRFLTSLPEV